MPKIAIILEGRGGELDRKIVSPDPKDPTDEQSDALQGAVSDAVNEWIMSVGDVIRIIEVE